MTTSRSTMNGGFVHLSRARNTRGEEIEKVEFTDGCKLTRVRSPKWDIDGKMPWRTPACHQEGCVSWVLQTGFAWILYFQDAGVVRVELSEPGQSLSIPPDTPYTVLVGPESKLCIFTFGADQGKVRHHTFEERCRNRFKQDKKTVEFLVLCSHKPMAPETVPVIEPVTAP
ncbi:MAG TPA: hypothetical protein VGE31_03440 [Candidatus Paceibacterota bacterium]